MKSPQSESFSVTTHQLASVFKALGSNTRLSILNYLISNPNSNCMRIVAALSHSQSTISKHLSELKMANIIKASTLDTVLVYQINQDFIVTIQGYLGAVNANVNKQKMVIELNVKQRNNTNSENKSTKLKLHNYVFKKSESKL